MGYNPGMLERFFGSMMAPVMVVVITFGLGTVTLSSEVTAQTWGRSKKEKKKEEPRITESELQSELMSFADRFAVIMSQGFENLREQSPSREVQFQANDTMVYAMSSAFTIAAGPNPQVALLDMAVLATLGRMIFEEHYPVKWGKPAEPMIRAFRQAEEDIWQIVRKVLAPEEQQELMEMIREWRRSHPEQVFFSYLRFSDFAATRQKSTLVKAVESGGLFGSVKKATQQVEETRLLAERAMFLGTRLPLLTGDFMNVWISRWLTNPEMERILANMDQVSGSAERLSKEMEKLPDRFADERNITIKMVMERVKMLRENIVADVMDRVTIERKAAIDQLMEGLASERKNLMQDIASEEEGVRPLLGDLNQTLTTANDLVTSANSLTDKLGMGQPKEPAAEPSKPFDIKEYQETMVQASTVIGQADGLLRTMEQVVSSPGWETTLKVFVETVDLAEKEGEEFVDYTMRKGILLIGIFLFGLLIVLICQQYFSKRVFGATPK
jgi:hypothetical protein